MGMLVEAEVDCTGLVKARLLKESLALGDDIDCILLETSLTLGDNVDEILLRSPLALGDIALLRIDVILDIES